MKLELEIREVHPSKPIICAFPDDKTFPFGHVVAVDGAGRRWFLAPDTQEELDEFAKAFADEVGMERPGKAGRED